MTAPLRAAEKTLIDAARPRIAEARHPAEDRRGRRRQDRPRRRDRRRTWIDGDKKTAALIDAAEARLELDAAAIPAEPCLFADDTTIERLGSRLAEQGGRFAVLSPGRGDLLHRRRALLRHPQPRHPQVRPRGRADPHRPDGPPARAHRRRHPHPRHLHPARRAQPARRHPRIPRAGPPRPAAVLGAGIPARLAQPQPRTPCRPPSATCTPPPSPPSRCPWTPSPSRPPSPSTPTPPRPSPAS